MLLLLASIGCSSSHTPITPETEGKGILAQSEPQSNQRWTWDMGLYHVSADHQSIDRIPQRETDLHLNVTPFMEPPKCTSCLKIGKPHVQTDGTLEIKVMLNHPFPFTPLYTGFDVKGTVIFPATRYWGTKWPFRTTDGYYIYGSGSTVPLNFSRADDGGGELLNADGYTFYLNPGLDLGPEFNLPIFNYSRGKYANGPDPDSTVNGFKLFTKDPERRMFRTYDTITRTYHIAPPDGEFVFGYVVDACWVQPTTTPVTNPAVDFPYYANCEEGYMLEAVQTQPFLTGGSFGKDEVISATFLNSPGVKMYQMFGFLICPDLAPSPYYETMGVATAILNGDWHYEEIEPGIFNVKLTTYDTTFTAPPGEYLALVLILSDNNWNPDLEPRQINEGPLFDFITLEVVQGE